MVHKALEDVVQSVLEQADSPPAVLEHRYRLDVFVDIDSNEVAPDIRDHYDGKEIGHTGKIPNMRAFDIEAARFHSLEHRLHLPPQFVHLKRLLRIAVRDKDLQFRPALPVLDFRAGQVTSLSINVVDSVQMLTLTQFQVAEQPERPRLSAMPEDTEVLSYSDMVMDASCVQIAQPFAPDELSVCHKMVDGVLTGKAHELFYEFNPFLCVGVAALVQHLEHDGESHPVVDDTQGEDVYVGVAELPVCPVQRQVVRTLDWNQF